MAKTLLLVFCSSFVALGTAPVAGMDHDTVAQLRNRIGVEVFPATGQKINRVLIRNTPLDENLISLLLRVEGLATLELNGTSIPDAAWAQFPQFRALKSLQITDMAVAKEKIEALKAAMPALTLRCRWSVGLDHPARSLTVTLPTVRVVYRDLKPVTIQKSGWSVDLYRKNYRFADVVIEPRCSRERKPNEHAFSNEHGYGDYVLDDGLYLFVTKGRWFRISPDGTTLTIDNQSFPIFGPQQTVIVDTKGRARQGPPVEARFWELEQTMLGTLHTKFELALTTKRPKSPSATARIEGLEAAPADPHAPVHNERHLAWAFGLMANHQAWGVHVCPLRSAKQNADIDEQTAEERWNLHKDWGVTLVLEVENGLRLYGDDRTSLGDRLGWRPLMHEHTSSREGRPGHQRWTINPTLGCVAKIEKLRANCFVEEGDFSFGVGSGMRDADFRVRTDGTAITIGEKSIELTPGRVTTVVLAGDKIKGDKVELVSVEKPK